MTAVLVLTLCESEGVRLLTHTGARVRHRPCDGGTLPPDGDPALDERAVRPSGDAQLGDLPVPGRVLASFAEAERGAGAFG